MYKFQFVLTATMVPLNQQSSHALPSRNPHITMQQPPLGFYGVSSFHPGPGPLYQGMAPSSQHVQQQHYLSPSHRQKKRFRMTGPQKPFNLKHESFGEVSNDRSTSVNPGMSQNNASNNPGKGKVWEPVKEPIINGWLQLNLADLERALHQAQYP